jgi:methyltransferase-like protein
MSKIYAGDIGTTFRINTEIDLTDATTIQILVKDPNGSTSNFTWNASVYGSASNGIIEYTTTEPFTVTGKYSLQAYIEFESGDVVFFGETITFTVHALWA